MGLEYEGGKEGEGRRAGVERRCAYGIHTPTYAHIPLQRPHGDTSLLHVPSRPRHSVRLPAARLSVRKNTQFGAFNNSTHGW